MRISEARRTAASTRVCWPELNSIIETLQEQNKENRTMRSDVLLGLWDDPFSLQVPQRQQATAFDWSRYGAMFKDDAIKTRLTLPL